MKAQLVRLYQELRRTGLPLLLAGFGLLFILKSGREIFAQQGGVLLWKLLLLGAGVTVAHHTRTQLFPYVDLSASLQEKTQAGATVFLGVAIIYAAIILALTSGL